MGTQAGMDCDVAVVGGGLVGASLALALSDAGRRIVLIEAAPPPAGEPSWDERCIALNAASREILSALGVWQDMAPLAAPIASTHISEQGRFGVARFTAAEAGLEALGYNLPIRHIGQTLWRHVRDSRVTILCPARVAGLQHEAEHIRLDLDAAPTRALRARLVVAADGANSALREMLQIPAETRDYGQCAIVSAIQAARPHGGCAYERFLPDGPIAVLPKPGPDCSLVWTVPGARAAGMLALSDAQFLHAAQEAFGERLGAWRRLGRRAAFPLARVMSSRLSAPRVLLAGNAAQSLHPVAAQGFNLGLRDVAAVAALVAGAADPGAAELLSQYAQGREPDRARVAGFTDQLVRTFSNRIPGLSGLRHWGLLALDLLPPVKQAVLWQSLGYASGLQAARRGQAP